MYVPMIPTLLFAMSYQLKIKNSHFNNLTQ